MVISFSDSMQLAFAARDRLIAGEDRRAAFRNALWMVGPACVLTHATAALSFVALQFSDSDLIKAFGGAGLIATITALVTVLTLVPALGVLLVRGEGAFTAKIRGADTRVDALRRFCGWVARGMEPARSLQPHQRRRGGGSGGQLCHSGATLSTCRSGSGSAAGGPRKPPTRRQAERRQSDRRADHVPEGRIALRARVWPRSARSMRSSRIRTASRTSGRSRPCAAGWRKSSARPMPGP